VSGAGSAAKIYVFKPRAKTTRGGIAVELKVV
jgi:hypothetical protein